MINYCLTAANTPLTLETDIMNTEEKLYKIEVMKTTTDVPAATDFVFNLVGTGTDVTDTITASDGSSGTVTFSSLKAGSYTLTETAPGGFDTWVSFSPDPKTSGNPGKSIAISIPGNVAEEGTVYVYFHNDPGTPPPPPPPPPKPGSIIINKTFIDGKTGSGIFGFTVYDSQTDGSQVATTSITITNGSSAQATVPGLTIGNTYWVEETSYSGATPTNPAAGVRLSVVAAENPTTDNTVTFVNKPGKPTVVTVAGVTEEVVEEEVEVLGIEEEVVEELPYTGFNFIFSLAGILLIMAGGILAATVFLPRKKGEIS